MYIDETMVTRKTVPLTEWARKRENMSVDVARLDEPTLALLSGISKEKGQEHYQIFERSVNVDKFFEYLAGLKQANGDAKICLFMDNLGVHTCPRSKTEMRRLKFRFVYNLPYRPDLNPIEFVFSQFKRNFKALRARKLVGELNISHEGLIVQAVEQLKK